MKAKKAFLVGKGVNFSPNYTSNVGEDDFDS